jgi:hypothetical protein
MSHKVFAQRIGIMSFDSAESALAFAARTKGVVLPTRETRRTMAMDSRRRRGSSDLPDWVSDASRRMARSDSRRGARDQERGEIDSADEEGEAGGNRAFRRAGNTTNSEIHQRRPGFENPEYSGERNRGELDSRDEDPSSIDYHTRTLRYLEDKLSPEDLQTVTDMLTGRETEENEDEDFDDEEYNEGDGPHPDDVKYGKWGNGDAAREPKSGGTMDKRRRGRALRGGLMSRQPNPRRISPDRVLCRRCAQVYVPREGSRVCAGWRMLLKGLNDE